MASKRVTIFHNPACGTSRNVLALLRERGIEPTVVEYMKTPPSHQQLREMISRSKLPVRDFLRKRERLYGELDLDNPKWSDDELVRFLAKNPSLLNRPVVETVKGIRSCRPAETVLDLLS